MEIVYRGVMYKRNPESSEWPKRVYYQAPRKSGRGYLHRDIYADVYGAIPPGHHIHHIDFNPFNNDPSNLTALTSSEHQKLHRERNGKFDEARMEIHRATTLKAAASWHSSKEGRAWHREHGKRVWEGREPDGVFTCPECGEEHPGHFASKTPGGQRYCSGRCRQRADCRTGKYSEERVCPVCGVTYVSPTKTKTRYMTCSRSCSAKRRWSQNKS